MATHYFGGSASFPIESSAAILRNGAKGWEDIIGRIEDRGGASAPAMAAWQGSIYQYSFGTSGLKEVHCEYHWPHTYAPNTDFYIHAHSSVIAAPTGAANWMFDIAWAKGYDQAVFEGTAGSALPITVSVTQTYSTAFRHYISEVQASASGGVISPAAVNVSITSGTPTLTAASALFSSSDIGRTVRVVGAGAAAANLDTTISAFTSTTEVTLASNASTTVTAQDAFRYRVIDTSLLEVDGLLIVRTWRDASRAADTLDVAPFIHTVDCHIQSTGLPTYGRNYPFYS